MGWVDGWLDLGGGTLARWEWEEQAGRQEAGGRREARGEWARHEQASALLRRAWEPQGTCMCKYVGKEGRQVK